MKQSTYLKCQAALLACTMAFVSWALMVAFNADARAAASLKRTYEGEYGRH